MAVLHAVGEAITKKTMLQEELKGPIGQDFLPQWVRRFPRLQGLHLEQGRALDTDAHGAIRDHRHSFDSFRLNRGTEAYADDNLANLLRSTSDWQAFGLYDIGKLSLIAMNHQQAHLPR